MTDVDKAVGQALLSENLCDILSRAEAGDKLAARDALQSLAFLLSTSNKHPTTKAPLPVPDFVRDYLSRAFYSMAYEASEGKNVDAAKALHLKGGPRKWGYFEKRLAAEVVFKFKDKFPVADNINGKDATTLAAKIINALVKETPCPQAWQGFKNHKAVDPALLKTWYYEFKDELEELGKRIEL